MLNSMSSANSDNIDNSLHFVPLTIVCRCHLQTRLELQVEVGVTESVWVVAAGVAAARVVALPRSQVSAAWLWCPTSTSTTTTTITTTAMGWQTECSKALAMDLALAKALTRVVAPCLLACRWIKAAADYSNNMEIPPPPLHPTTAPCPSSLSICRLLTRAALGYIGALFIYSCPAHVNDCVCVCVWFL